MSSQQFWPTVKGPKLTAVAGECLRHGVISCEVHDNHNDKDSAEDLLLLSWLRTLHNGVKVYKQQIQSILEYASCRWDPLPKTLAARFKDTQKRAAQATFNISQINHISPTTASCWKCSNFCENTHVLGEHILPCDYVGYPFEAPQALRFHS